MALTEDPTDVGTEFGNYSNFVYYFNKLFAFQEELIPIISQDHLTESESSHIFEVLLPNSDSKAICDQIHLIQQLN